ncbi:MAG: DUF805 domain-containing protein [Rhodospirillaceae bacterium]
MSFFRFSGRRNRAYFAKVLGVTVIVDGAILFSMQNIHIPVKVVLLLIANLPAMSAAARRLHDINLSAHWLWISPLLGAIWYFDWVLFHAATGSSLICVLFHAALLFLLFKKGDRHRNQFGRPDIRYSEE